LTNDAAEGRTLRGPKPPAEPTPAPAPEPARNVSKSPIYARQDRPTRQSKVSSSFAESVKNAERDLLERS
jgi:hypothetical protein